MKTILPIFFILITSLPSHAQVIEDSIQKLNKALTELQARPTKTNGQKALTTLVRIDALPAVHKLATQMDYATKTVINNDPRFPHTQQFLSQLYGRIVRSSGQFERYNSVRDKLINEIRRLVVRGLKPADRAKALKAVPKIRRYSPPQLKLIKWAQDFRGQGAGFAKSIETKIPGLRKEHRQYTMQRARKHSRSREARGEKIIRAPISPEIFN